MQYIHAEEKSCRALPNTEHFIRLEQTRQPRSGSLIRASTELITPVIHAHDPFRVHNRPHACAGPTDLDTPAAVRDSRSICRHHAVDLGADKDTVDGEEQRPLGVLLKLDALHATYPALDYLQYKGRLQEQGIHYLFVASMFDADFYITSVGMVPGAAHLFCHWVAEERRKVSRSGQQKPKKEGDDSISG